jgi:hypothetical protein
MSRLALIGLLGFVVHLDAQQPSAQPALKPRVLLRAPKRTGGWSNMGSRSVDVSKDFLEVCPEVRISINMYMADYTVEVNSTQHGFVPENQMLVANKDGDLISRVTEWGGMKGGVRKACAAILNDWVRK